MSGMCSVGALSTVSVTPPPAPTAPVITNARSVASQNPLFNVASGGSTTSNNLNIFGTSSYPSATISVYIGGVFQGTTTTNISGNWTYALGIQGDSTFNVYATLTYNGLTSVASNTYTLTIAPGLTSLPVSIGQNMTDNQTFNWCGLQFATNSTNQTSGHTNNACCVVVDTHTLSFTLLPTDLYTDFGSSNRTEIAQNNARPSNGNTLNISYEVLFSSSSPVNDAFGGGKWCVVGQLHDSGGSSPTYEQNLGGDAVNTGTTGDEFCIDYYNGSTFNNLYQYGSNIARGVWHTIDMILLPSTSGSGLIKVWLDGVQVVNHSGAFNGITPYYWKMGMYRGGLDDETQVLQYRNFLYNQST